MYMYMYMCKSKFMYINLKLLPSTTVQMSKLICSTLTLHDFLLFTSNANNFLKSDSIA